MSVDTVAIIGLGEAGHTLHLPALAGLDGIEVVGGCDVSEAMRRRASSTWGVPVFDDVARMLEDTDPDVVIVATPPETHLDHAVRALSSGAHVICEKPFVCSLAEADRILDAARAADRQVALNHEFREMPIFKALRAAGGEGRNVVFAQAWQLIDLPPSAEGGWRGGMLHRTLFEAGVHQIDYLMALFGEQPRAVQALTSDCGVTAEGSDAVVVATLEFSGGRLANLVQNRVCKGERQYFEVRADTRTASLRASFGGRARVSAGLFRSTRPHVRLELGASGLAWQEESGRRRVLARNPKDPMVFATRSVLEQTLAAFREGGAPPSDGRWGRDVLEVIVACYHAAATGRRLALDSDEAKGLTDVSLGARS